MFLKKVMLQIDALKIHGVVCRREGHALIIRKGRLFRSLYCQTPNNCIYLMPVQQMSNTERVKALRMSRKTNKNYSNLVG